MTLRALLVSLAAALVLSLAACGGDDDGGGDSGQSDALSSEADPEAVEVIEGWSSTLSEGDIEGAADYFALPSVAQNGTPPLDLDSREDVIAFNEALPCGAELVETVEHAGFVIATFELRDRPGGDCGNGVGGEAQTAFQIEDGKIVEWRRTGGGSSPTEPAEDRPIV